MWDILQDNRTDLFNSVIEKKKEKIKVGVGCEEEEAVAH